MTPQEIGSLIESAMPGSRAVVESGDNVHFEAVVIAEAFHGKRAVQRHQLVYAALGAKVGNEIHALALKVFTPEEWRQQGQG
jgi:acid stress-induced BolA-like protein IbaG/YrbA